jgi:general secretion pathway protein E
VNQPLDLPLGTTAFDAEAIRLARAVAAEQGKRWLEVLQEQSRLDAAAFTARLAATARLPLVDMASLHRLAPAFDILPFAEALQHECVPLHAQGGEGGELWLAIADPYNAALRDWIDERLRRPVRLCLAHAADIAAYLARHEENLRAMDGLVVGAAEGGSATALEDLSLRRIQEDTSPVVKLVNSTLYDALKLAASDIHLESTGGGLLIKYRVDGVLTRVGSLQGAELAEQVISRIKVLAELDIAERRVPQDGRFKVAARGREIDLRVSIMPSIHGEDAVLRILDKQHLADEVLGLRLDSLGFDAPTIATLRRLSREPYGMLLVTGPTGSGKTTTLYAAITEINDGHDKIVTIEDPVEYQLPGVLQIPVNEKKGLTFARGLRSILRHDPDKIMVGEIRDGETAQIAVQAALTGHLVFTTVHANNVFDVIGRFMHMGVDPYNLVSALNAVVAQRLVRLNCPQCASDLQPDAAMLAESGIDEPSGYRFRAGKGCGHCRGTGYKGRSAIAEMLVLNDELRELIIAREPLRKIKEAARRNGTRNLRDAGLALVAQGLTSLEELNRVTFVA